MVEMSCQICGSEDVDTSEDFDYFCSKKPTLSCICNACGFSWYRDPPEE